MEKMKIKTDPTNENSPYWEMDYETDGEITTTKNVTVHSMEEQARREMGLTEYAGENSKSDFPLLGQVIAAYLNYRVAELSAVLSDEDVRRILCRISTADRILFFEESMLPIDQIDYQLMIDYEVKQEMEGYIIASMWDVVCKAFKYAGYEPPPKVKLPPLEALPTQTMERFFSEIKGWDSELAILLFVHGLSPEEIAGLKRSDIFFDEIRVRGAMVDGEYHRFDDAIFGNPETHFGNYTIRLPRLYELIGNAADQGCLVKTKEDRIMYDIKRVCRKLGIRLKSPAAALRRSFIAYITATTGTPLGVIAGHSQSWAITEEMEGLVTCYEGELLEREFDKRHEAGNER